MAKRKAKKSTRAKTGKVARTTNRRSMTGKQPGNPFYIDDVRPLI